MARDDEPVEIDLYQDVILGAVRLVYQRLRVALVARTTSFARNTSRVAIEFTTRFLATDRSERNEPPIADIPVILPRAGGYGFYADLRQGDPAVVLACDGPVRNFFETGQTVTPQMPNGHHYGCAVAFAGGRVSNTETPTPPPNDAGEALFGADDGSACVIFRGAGLPSLTELGSVVIATSGPSSSLKLGGDAATLGVARLTDTVDRNVLMTTWMSQVTAALNTLAPASVTPFVTPTIGTISGASTKVVSE